MEVRIFQKNKLIEDDLNKYLMMKKEKKKIYNITINDNAKKNYKRKRERGENNKNNNRFDMTWISKYTYSL